MRRIKLEIDRQVLIRHSFNDLFLKILEKLPKKTELISCEKVVKRDVLTLTLENSIFHYMILTPTLKIIQDSSGTLLIDFNDFIDKRIELDELLGLDNGHSGQIYSVPMNGYVTVSGFTNSVNGTNIINHWVSGTPLSVYTKEPEKLPWYKRFFNLKPVRFVLYWVSGNRRFKNE